ncbi:2-hydroxy-3-carboxy-6-oxo-7-methylocta-2,4-dienoate decarboxylase [Streptomyces yokosukanensis]|uniref:2-hydroxy-3-carboxy-6-oxo-7-methylocta-2, 4-dienoate decarboxylase n=1 Tax=Streptomyces yokosukanensis TaxID=67386 RepID=A0A101P1V6_9ACTN|nr:amidohydrolase family protein [Streptomyces yokosukanensis]KUN03367.1 2-hydroxy-3-carboxy-6-oxo-7-methylocta-2,4-dienoate decarboxylase [Streptomyces yokosukanensis]
MNGALRAGVIDVHAHWLPRDLLALPPGNPLGGMHDRDGELFLGRAPLGFPTAAMTDVDTVVADTRKAGLGARVVSAPPFAFPVHAPAEADEYIASYNAQLAAAVADTDGVLVGLGLVRLDDVDAARRELTEIAAAQGVAGVAVPPVVDGRSLDRDAPREILGIAAELGLSVLVHPMQLPRTEWDHHYLVNLIGNPVESTTAVAAVVLGGVLEELPSLRICFVHGGGCAPSLLGRWGHGWRSRGDVRRGSTRPPAESFSLLYFDTITHDPDVLELLRAHASPERIVCGSDYPFDMAQPDPVGFPLGRGIDAGALEANGRRFLGLTPMDASR